MKLEFQYDQLEYVKARRKFLLMSKIISKMNIFLLAIITILELYQIIQGNGGFVIVLGILLLLCYGMLFLLYVIQPKWIFDKLKENENSYQVSILPKQINVKDQLGETVILWERCLFLYETSDFIYFVFPGKQYFFIPKRVIEVEKQEKLKTLYQKQNPKGKYKYFK